MVQFLENIYLGMNDEEKDYKLLEKYLKMVKLNDFFQDLPFGLEYFTWRTSY